MSYGKVLLLSLTLSTVALADEAEDLFQAGLRAEDSLDFAGAAAAYERSLALRPSASFAHRARIRLDDLRGHGEGGFEPLRRLEQVRRAPARASNAAELQALFDDAQRFPPGRTQAEALLLAAEGLLRRASDPARAVAPASALARGEAFDRPLRSRGLVLWVDALRAQGREAEARAALRSLPGLAPALERELLRNDRRARLGQASAGVALASVLAGALSLLKLRRGGRWRRLAAPTSLAVALAIALGGVAFTRVYDESLSVRPFVGLGLGVVLIERCSAAARYAFASSRAARLVVVLLGMASIAAVAYLSLYWGDPAYLDGFGL